MVAQTVFPPVDDDYFFCTQERAAGTRGSEKVIAGGAVITPSRPDFSSGTRV